MSHTERHIGVVYTVTHTGRYTRKVYQEGIPTYKQGTGGIYRGYTYHIYTREAYTRVCTHIYTMEAYTRVCTSLIHQGGIYPGKPPLYTMVGIPGFLSRFTVGLIPVPKVKTGLNLSYSGTFRH